MKFLIVMTVFFSFMVFFKKIKCQNHYGMIPTSSAMNRAILKPSYGYSTSFPGAYQSFPPSYSTFPNYVPAYGNVQPQYMPVYPQSTGTIYPQSVPTNQAAVSTNSLTNFSTTPQQQQNQLNISTGNFTPAVTIPNTDQSLTSNIPSSSSSATSPSQQLHLYSSNSSNSYLPNIPDGQITSPTIISSNGESGSDVNSLPPQVKEFMSIVPQILANAESQQNTPSAMNSFTSLGTLFSPTNSYQTPQSQLYSSSSNSPYYPPPSSLFTPSSQNSLFPMYSTPPNSFYQNSLYSSPLNSMYPISQDSLYPPAQSSLFPPPPRPLFMHKYPKRKLFPYSSRNIFNM